MNKTIKINEQDLKRLVKESIDELKYSTYKRAHDKMQDKGQRNRAADFRQTFKDIYDDSNTSFNLDNDNVWLSNPEDNEKGIPANSTLFHRDGTMTAYKDGKYGVLDTPQRTSDRALARKHAKKLDFFYGDDNSFDKNDFISECVNKVFNKFLR